MENALSREEALKATTIWAALANFEENEKGSLEPGKFADFVILNSDIMAIPGKDIQKTKVLATYIGGERVF
jgi:predicted amidohydrolase YtcJ